MDSAPLQRNGRLTSLVALPALLALAAWHSQSRWFLIDDAFISFRYARNLAEGAGLVFNAGERVEGYTSFLWTCLSAGAIRAGLAPETVIPAMGIAASLLLLAALYCWSRELGLPPAWALVAPAMLAVNRSYAGWATGGLETRFFSLLIVTLAWRLDVERRRDAATPRPFSAILAGLACLTRPEGWLSPVIRLLTHLRRPARAGRAARTGRAARARRAKENLRSLAIWLGVFASIAGTHLIWRMIYYDDWLPNSFRAKVPGLRLESGLVYLGLFALHHLAAPLAAACLTLPAGFGRIRSIGASVARDLSGFALPFCAAYVAYTALIGGDHFEFRFLDPVLPFLFVSLALFSWRCAHARALASRASLPAPLWAKAWAAAAAGLLVVAAGVSAVLGFSGFDATLRFMGRERSVSIVSMEAESAYLDHWSRMGRWLARHAAEGESIAVAPAGAIPWYSGLRTLDMLGINDRDLAAMPPMEGLNIGHERMATLATVRSRGITYLIGSPDIRRSRATEWSDDLVEVYFGDFYWYFRVLTPDARIRPGSYR